MFFRNNQHRCLDDVFSALADPTRRAMMQRLKSGPAMVTELAKPFAMSLPAVSKHIRILEKSSLVQRTRKGREHWCQLNPETMDEALKWLQDHCALWSGLLDSLENHLEK